MSRTPHFFAPGGFVTGTAIIVSRIAGWSSLVARRAHNPKVVGSNPAPATKALLPSATDQKYRQPGTSVPGWCRFD